MQEDADNDPDVRKSAPCARERTVRTVGQPPVSTHTSSVLHTPSGAPPEPKSSAPLRPSMLVPWPRYPYCPWGLLGCWFQGSSGCETLPSFGPGRSLWGAPGCNSLAFSSAPQALIPLTSLPSRLGCRREAQQVQVQGCAAAWAASVP
jgi:hypothetical protein